MPQGAANAPVLEAYPLDAELTPSSSSTGYASTFSRAGFKTVCAACRPARLCATIWRETGAKRGDFRLQSATMGARSERRDGHRWDCLKSQVRTGLPAGGRWIRTSSSGASGEADAILPVKDRPGKAVARRREASVAQSSATAGSMELQQPREQRRQRFNLMRP